MSHVSSGESILMATAAAADRDDFNEPPLCIDLDGTLIKSDILIESLFAMLKENFFLVFLLPLWLLRGKAYLKDQIAQRATVEVRLLPYHAGFLDFAKAQRAAGRKLVLATASHRRYAEQIASHLGVFDDVLASDATRNLSGSVKAQLLIARFGERGFDYAANAPVDVAIWRHARWAILVNPEPGAEAAARALGNVERVFDDRRGGLTPYLAAIRVHQWLKNLLVFVPLLAAHRITEWELFFDACLAFVAFSLCASSVYLLNDLLDLPADRAHPRKRERPFAAGTVRPIAGAALIPLLLLASLLVCVALPAIFSLVLLVYYACTVAYSFYLKRVVLVDVLVLAGLYTLRVIGGAAAVYVEPSFWLLALSMFMFMSLALVKRSAELYVQRAREVKRAKGRGYRTSDLEYLHSMGTASGYMAVLVVALYINGEAVAQGYQHPYMLWLVCPLLLYWVSRMWLKAGRGEMHDDPLVFAVKDRQSQLIALAVFAAAWAAL